MSFDVLAPHYTWMEIALAGGRLQRCRCTWLDELVGCDDILIAGVGHGHFLRVCSRRLPEARITSLDASAAMLSRARERARRGGGDMGRLSFVHASLPEWKPRPKSYDAVVTHFFLDCFPSQELGNVIDRLAAAARPKAT